MGITKEEENQFMAEFERTGALEHAVVFLNLADDPAVERIITPAACSDNCRIPGIQPGLPRAGYPDRYDQLL